MSDMATPIEELLEVLRESGLAPNLAAGVAFRVGPGAWSTRCFGESATRFDLASVTKSMFAVAVARSTIAGRPAKDARLGELLVEARGTATEDLPLELLLSHRAGMTAHIPLWLATPFDREAALREAAASRTGDGSPVYSDLGYLLAGEGFARALGYLDAGAAIEALLVHPLHLDNRLGTARSLAAKSALEPVAATEVVPFRDGLVRGIVHDENAWAVGGSGGCGHAGMFGTVDAVLAFGCAVLDALDHLPNPLFGQTDTELDPSWMVRPRPGGTLRAGFDGKSETGSSAGPSFGPNSFGHLGFTGTSLWIDPDAKIVAAFLSNRVCPTRENHKIKEARPRVHDALHRWATINRPR